MDVIDIIGFTIPAIITSGTAYYFFKTFSKEQENLRKFDIYKENQKQALPIRLQAYERMTLFLERINPNKLILRVTPTSDNKVDYFRLLEASIDQELDHNLTQQIYISNDAWAIVLTAKQAIIKVLQQTTANQEVQNSEDFRKAVLTHMIEMESPTDTAIAFLKNELAESIR